MLIRKNLNTIQSLLIVFVFTFGACQPSENATKHDMSVVRVGVLPEMSEERIHDRYHLLFDYLSKEINLPIKYVPSKNYAQYLENFHKGEIDLAYFGGVSFIQAFITDQATPLVMRDIDSLFSSLFLVRTNHPAQNLQGIKGAKFSFGSKLSTSGHLMPRFFLREQGIRPETFFKETLYSGQHDKTALWVQEGKVEAGVANSRIVNSLFNKNILKEDQVRVLWETPPYSDYVWAAHPSLNKSLQDKIKDAFMKLDRSNPQHLRIMEPLDAGSFLPSHISDFADLKKVYEQLNTPEAKE